MTVPEIRDRYTDSLKRWGAYLKSGNEYSLLLSSLLPYLPDAICLFVWRREGRGRYRLKHTTLPVEEQLPAQLPATLEAAYPDVTRGIDVLECSTVSKTMRPIAPLFFGRGQVEAKCVLLAGGSKEGVVIEAYFGSHSDQKLDTALIGLLIDAFYEVRTISLELFDVPHRTAVSVPAREDQLFTIILREIKAWLGSSLGEAHLFLYDGRDRMLYHRALTSLGLSPEGISGYTSSPASKDVALLQYVRDNIAMSDHLDDARKDALCQALEVLKDERAVQKSALSLETELRQLLAFLPQEPGTGVAGLTAVTHVPEISRPNDVRWTEDYWSGTKFSLMLSVEKLFGVAGSGSMAAVPLLESGQIAGVLFVTRPEPFSQAKDLPELMEKAAQASHLLTLYRTQSFQNAVTRRATASGADIMRLAAEYAPLAFNVLYAAHWRVAGSEVPTVEAWGFVEASGRWGHLGTWPTERGDWRPIKTSMRTDLLRWSRSQAIQPIHLDANWAPRVGIPKEVWAQQTQMLGTPFRSACAVTLSHSSDVLVMYFADAEETLNHNEYSIWAKIRSIRLIQELRQPAPDIELLVGLSWPMKQLEEQMKSAAGCKRILLLGNTGTGKSRVAQHLAARAQRNPDRYKRLNLSHITDTMLAAELFGHTADAYSSATTATKGFLGSYNGGTLFLDEIQDASEQAQAMLLTLTDDDATFTPLGQQEEEIRPDVLVIAGTNVPEEKLVSEGIRETLVLRLSEATVTVPDLNSRRSDIPLLMRHFFRQSSVRDIRLTAEAWLKLLNANWTGNVRTLLYVAQPLARGTALKFGAEDIVKRLGVTFDGASEFILWRLAGAPYSGETGGDEIELLIGPHTYEPNESPENDWAACAASAFRSLRAMGVSGDRFWSVGTGSGLDAIAARRILGSSSLTLFDVQPEVLGLARENVLINCPDIAVGDVSIYESDILSAAAGLESADVIYENLPNIPPPVGRTILKDGRACATFQHAWREAPAPYQDSLLANHYAFLVEARAHLAPGGVVVCAIGARVPWSIISEMFAGLGYEPSLLWHGLKRQEQPEDVVAGYAKAEPALKDQTFRFYRFPEAQEAWRARTAIAANRPILEHALAIEGELHEADLQVDAKTALTDVESGKDVGHFVYLVAGRRRGDA